MGGHVHRQQESGDEKSHGAETQKRSLPDNWEQSPSHRVSLFAIEDGGASLYLSAGGVSVSERVKVLVGPVQDLVVHHPVVGVWILSVLLEAARCVDPWNLGNPVFCQYLVRISVT